MRILHLIQRYWPAVGGSETHMRELSRRLVADGHQVTVITTDALDYESLFAPGHRQLAQREAQDQGVRILRFPVRHLPFSPRAFAGWRRLLWVLSSLRPVPVGLIALCARLTPWIPGIWRWLRTTGEPFDLVAGLNVCFEPILEAGLRFAHRRGIPFVCYPITHLGAGEAPGQDSVGSFYTMRHQLAVVRASDAVAAQTPTERDFYIRQGVLPERIEVIGPGVNPHEIVGGDGERFRRQHDVREPLVVALSAMARDKGTVQVVEAVRRLWRADRPVELALAGAILTPFRDYLDRLPVEDRRRIRLLGSIPEQDKRDLLAAADIVAVPSRTDSFGIVYLEAWLYGKPVIGARAWGMEDVIADGQDGLLVPFDDAPALAGAISYLVDRPALRAEMGVRGERKVLERHTWDVKYTQVRALYQRLRSDE
jgi:glycosyltransferase involved in cell wall biosynthesis